MSTIYCYKLLFDHISTLFCRNGRPLPGNYVTGSKEFSDKYVTHLPANNVHSKATLKHLVGEKFLPETYFPREKVETNGENRVFFLKNINKDNGKGIKLLKGEEVPPIVPLNHVLQPAISSVLYHQRKFDIRFLICVKRTGEIMIYKNCLYRINPNVFLEAQNHVDSSLYMTNTHFHGVGSLSFFEKTHPGEFDIENFLDQVSDVIPRIFNSLLPISNNGYPEPLDSSYFVAGLDFMQQRQDKKLLFLELNLTPGWSKSNGLNHYQDFYHLVTDFILENDRNTDECIYTSTSAITQ